MRMLTFAAAGMLLLAAGCGGNPETSPGTDVAAPAVNSTVSEPPPVPEDAPDRMWFQTGGLQGVFAPGEAARISVENALGDIAVVGGSDDTVSAVARLHAMGTAEAEAHARAKEAQLRGALQDGDLVLTVEGGDDLTFVSLEITVPSDREVRLDASAGKAAVHGLQAAVSISGTVGDITVADVRGPLDIHAETADVTARAITEGATVYTSSGKIELTDIGGPIIARSMTGAISLSAASNDVIANTQSGNIELRLTRPLDGSLEARAAGGNIELRLPSNSNCRVTTMTNTGDITNELPLEDVEQNGVNIAGRLGEGTGALLATTSSGNILIAPME